MLQPIRDEFKESDIVAKLNDAEEEFQEETGGDDFRGIAQETAREIYCLIRDRRPSAVVETGVFNGFSTFTILRAMEKNQRGRLHSIDLPYRGKSDLDEFREITHPNHPGAALPDGKNPGWMVPEHLKARWSLHEGRVQDELKPLCESVEPVNIFLLDACTDPEGVLFELETAWRNLAEGGTIILNKAGRNDAFESFCQEKSCTYGTLANNVGWAVNEA